MPRWTGQELLLKGVFFPDQVPTPDLTLIPDLAMFPNRASLPDQPIVAKVTGREGLEDLPGL